MLAPMIIAIDPGLTGGIAWKDGDKPIAAIKMPSTILDLYNQIEFLAHERVYVYAFIENVGGYRPGNSAPSAVKFGRHCGHWDMALLALKVPTTRVAPSTWMRSIMNAVPAEKTKRKNVIKDAMQRAYPHLKITLATADAIGILHYALIDFVPKNPLLFPLGTTAPSTTL